MKKQAALIAICAALIICVAAAGCTGPSSSPSASPSVKSSSKTTQASATPTITPLPTVTPSPTGKAGYTIYYFYEEGCPSCAAFSQTSDYTTLSAQPGFTPILNTSAQGIASQYGVTVNGYPTVMLVNTNTNTVVNTWEYPHISAATVLAAET